ncbi:hypothetical protein [Pseudomonas sp. S37]|uniref:hypothetical protein n=1 Tax=Pseudomonas sp. S37 TaxID=2767449 RepID=UPI001911E9F4|nr:hypothetical protein [Pseudomonas sp. S37]
MLINGAEGGFSTGLLKPDLCLWMKEDSDLRPGTDKVGAGVPAKRPVQSLKIFGWTGAFAGTPAPTGKRLT